MDKLPATDLVWTSIWRLVRGIWLHLPVQLCKQLLGEHIHVSGQFQNQNRMLTGCDRSTPISIKQLRRWQPRRFFAASGAPQLSSSRFKCTIDSAINGQALFLPLSDWLAARFHVSNHISSLMSPVSTLSLTHTARFVLFLWRKNQGTLPIRIRW